MSADDLVIVDLSTENADLLGDTYCELSKVAIAMLAERNRELEAARRRIVSLIDEVRAARETAAA